LRAVLVLAALLLLLIPLLRLTQGTAAPALADASPAEPRAKQATVHLELLSTRVPFHFELRYLGKVIWQGESMEAQVKKAVAMEFPKEGVDLELKGGWREDGASVAAVKLTVIPSDQQPREKSVWAQKEFDEVLTFQ